LHGYAVSAEQESDCAGALSKIAGKPRLTGDKVGSTHPFQSIGELGHFVERERGDVDAHLAIPDLEVAPSRQVAGRHDNGFLIGLFPCNAREVVTIARAGRAVNRRELRSTRLLRCGGD
jgi:hypothetical protein